MTTFFLPQLKPVSRTYTAAAKQCHVYATSVVYCVCVCVCVLCFALQFYVHVKIQVVRIQPETEQAEPAHTVL
jgi:hypothetical protein